MFRPLTFLFLAAPLTCALALPARADEGAAPRGREGRRAAMKARLLERFDANKDGTLDETERAAAKAARKARLDRAPLDRNGDGRVGPRERRMARHGMKHRRHHAVKAQVRERFDANKDGTLDEAERAAAKVAFEQKRAERKAKVLEAHDANRDGTLDEAERKAAREARQAKRAQRRADVLARFDVDHDGRLNETERAAAREARKTERAAKCPEGAGR